MSIERAFFGYVIDCDFCPNFLNCDTEFFRDAIDMAKGDGWKMRKQDDEWIHICPVCVEKKGL